MRLFATVRQYGQNSGYGFAIVNRLIIGLRFMSNRPSFLSAQVSGLATLISGPFTSHMILTVDTKED